jgi:phospholipase/carboxylesterase
MCHGIHDNVVKYEWAKKSADTVSSYGSSVDVKTYEMDHNLCDDEISDIMNFLRKQLK